MSWWWRALYVRGIKPVQGMPLWKRLRRLAVLPPPERWRDGRPNLHARKKSPHESSSNPNKLTKHGRVITCSNCKKQGHNKTRCSNPQAPPAPKRSRGRPKKNQESWSVGSQAGVTGSEAHPTGIGYSV